MRIRDLIEGIAQILTILLIFALSLAVWIFTP